MCGIAGFWSRGELRNGSDILRTMTGAIRHRGPDADGHWCDPDAGIFIGHRRLSILDLSSAGVQPMASPGGRFVISFNGEIYNFRELRVALEQRGIRFRGHSDTEVLVAGIEEWGVRRALERSTGMFAFALWDREARELVLARDRIGEKPLYYGWSGDALLFGSEIKALRRHTSWRGSVDRSAVAVFLRHNYIPAPHSIYRGIRKVVPGTFVVARQDGTFEETRYWSLRDVVERGQARRFRGTEQEAAEELEQILATVVGQQMVSDVPLGAFLSGGVDSSLVVALMQKHSTRRVKTFTIGFEEPTYDESAHARAVAEHLGTDHTCMTVTSREALDVIPSLADLYDEPFADSSQIPTCLVSKVARTGVTVSLSGDGGDETFGGYPRYAQMLQLWGRLRWSPAIVRQALSHAINALSVRQWDGVMRRIPRRGVRAEVQGERLHKLAWMLRQGSLEGLYRGLVTHWPDPSAVALGAPEAGTALTSPATWPTNASVLQQLMYLDSVSYLPDDIFAKVDRASMAVSLETRAPLVDRRVIEFAWTLPTSMHYAAGRGKRPLRRLLDKYVPASIIERPKMGFGMPVREWLRGPLRGWAESLLEPARLRREGLFDVATVRTRWEEHVSGERNWHYPLWDVLMFQAWQERQ
jgi:asparagine synthase (glutamine-hydrolysing)